MSRNGRQNQAEPGAIKSAGGQVQNTETVGEVVEAPDIRTHESRERRFVQPKVLTSAGRSGPSPLITEMTATQPARLTSEQSAMGYRAASMSKSSRRFHSALSKSPLVLNVFE